MNNVGITSDYEAKAGDVIAVDTRNGPITVMLPPWPYPWDAAVEFIDIMGTFATNNLTVHHNAQPIASVKEDLIASTNNAAFKLIYSGADMGWQVIRTQ